MTEKTKHIPLSDCKHGHGYWLKSRNLSYGVFDENTKGFVGIRTKFSNRFLFTEYHWDTGSPFSTACPIELDKKCPIDNLTEYVGEFCAEGREIEHRVERVLEGGAEIGWRYHKDDGSRLPDTETNACRPFGLKKHSALFDWIQTKIVREG